MSEIRGTDGALPLDGDKYTTWDAAYVFGALSDAERREFEGHLGSCARCHRNVGDLAGMPPLLGLLTPDDVASIDESGHLDAGMPPVPQGVLGSLLDTVRQRRRRTRLLAWTGGCVAAAAAAAVVVVAVHPGLVAPTPSRQAGRSTVSMTSMKPGELTATVSLVSHVWGTGIEMNCTYHSDTHDEGDDADDTLAMVAVGRDGSRNRLATWIARSGVLATPTGSTSLSVDQIASVQVVDADTGEVVLQRDE